MRNGGKIIYIFFFWCYLYLSVAAIKQPSTAPFTKTCRYRGKLTLISTLHFVSQFILSLSSHPFESRNGSYTWIQLAFDVYVVIIVHLVTGVVDCNRLAYFSMFFKLSINALGVGRSINRFNCVLLFCCCFRYYQFTITYTFFVSSFFYIISCLNMSVSIAIIKFYTPFNGYIYRVFTRERTSGFCW